MQRMKISLVALVIAAIVVGAFVVGNHLPEKGLQVKGDPKPTVPLDVKLKLSSIPSLNQEVNLSFQVKTFLDEKQLDIKIQLPEGVKVINGNLQQIYHDLPADGIIEHEITIAIREPGNYSIKSSAGSQWNPSYMYGKNDEICISVTKTAAEVIDCHPTLPETSTEQISEQIEGPTQPPETSLPGGKKQ